MTRHTKRMKTIVLGEKELFMSQPYRPRASTFVGRDQESALVLASWANSDGRPPLNPLLTGPPGVGKNRLVYECSSLCNQPLCVLQGHEDLTPEDLVCSVRFSDDADRKMDYILTPLVTAMVHGGICLLDELGKMRPKAMAMLSSLLDERRYLDSSLLGLRIKAHPRFRFVAATNTADVDGNVIPDYIISRLFPIVRIGSLSKKEIETVVRAEYRMPGKALEPALEAFWRVHKEAGAQPTPRAALCIFSLASSLAGYRSDDSEVRPSDVEKAFSLMQRRGPS
jgi:MoxR-like ATPase